MHENQRTACCMHTLIPVRGKRKTERGRKDGRSFGLQGKQGLGMVTKEASPVTAIDFS